MHRLVGPGLAVACLAASAQTVTLSGSMGDKALLVINGMPRTVAVGATQHGVKLVSVSPNEAVIELQGKRVPLQLGGAPVNLGGAASEGSGSQIVLTAGPGGHFVTGGSINGQAVQFVVDTGATYVAMSQSEADRIGLKYKAGRRGLMNTANGQVPAYITSLDVVRVGDVQVYHVDAVVFPAAMDIVLLGNSFLTRFQMKRENDRMTLERRP
ncbi:retropepsin-like aspartic protease [Piscinibacter sp. XHJ-5]|uniref:retropepsin-like aspartic protease family protein n=1 Tax=Piscinibacter sp. XHJ-5 TaxID=3037797 RepID=UPI002453455B|nr:retropepsin-like aspartic protease [Piscinibacter sp. XHJ-5]